MRKTLKFKRVGQLIIAALFIFITNQVNAQEGEGFKRAEFGLRFMPTVTDMDVNSSGAGEVSGSVVLGFGIGAILGFNFSRHVGIQTELIYSSISQNTTENNIQRKINLRYVNVPLLLSLNTGKTKLVNLNVVAGPQVGFNLGSSVNMTGPNDPNDPQGVLSVKKNDFGFAYGAGVDFGLNPARTLRLGLGYRGVFGLLDISDRSRTLTTDSYYILDRTKVNTHSAYAGVSLMF